MIRTKVDYGRFVGNPKVALLRHQEAISDSEIDPAPLCDFLYAHPEFTYPMVNLMYVGAPVAENQSPSCGRFREATGQRHCGDSPLGCFPRNRDIVRAGKLPAHLL